ncbi:DMT family transporter [Microbacterium sp. A8/3-1]|uniref:DMT family transporter n=1 Tax=Microbacterium sp. A8/3-1 TaxID=3160749 RepID=A0AAU7VRE1_9MICO
MSSAGGTRPQQESLLRESLLLVVLLAATWVIAGFALEGAGVGVVAAGRAGFAALGLFLLTLLPRRGGARSAPPDRTPAGRGCAWWQLGILSLTGVTGYTVLSTVAISLAGPAIPSLILALSPVVTLVAESLLSRVRMSLLVLASTTVAIVGAVLYVLPRLGAPGGASVLGVLAAVGAMLSMAAYGLLFAHLNRGRRGPMAPRILPIFALGSVPLVLWAVVEVWSGGLFEPWAILALAVLGLAVYVPAYLVQHRIIATAGASHAALLGLAVPPVVGLAAAVLGLAALPQPLQVWGIVLTLAGMLVVIRSRSQRPRSTASR